MNNELSELLIGRKILLKKSREIDFAKYSRKRNYTLILGVDNNNFYNIIFFRKAKSKFLNKELAHLNEISSILESEVKANIKKRILFYSSEICSKVKLNKDWKFYDFV